jgi:hypothetical protein
MYVRVKRDILTIFVKVEASDTVNKLKEYVFQSLTFRDTVSSSSLADEAPSSSLHTIQYDSSVTRSPVTGMDDIGLVHIPHGSVDDIFMNQDSSQGGEASSTSRKTFPLLDGLKTLVDSKVENDDVICVVLRKGDGWESPHEVLASPTHADDDNSRDVQV